MALRPTDPQLILKTTPPRIARTALERARLSSTRPEFADKSVIVLQAPSGWGKTSLLAQWRKEALQAGQLVAWLALDGRDTDIRLVHGLAAAMRAASGRASLGQACMQVAAPGDAALEGLTEWLAEVAELAAETLLILDDAHALPESVANSSLAYLLLNAPANLRVVLASRRPLALPVVELPARGHYAELTTADLRLEPAETVALLQARFGERIDLDTCMRLHELVEGWPLGLQLAVSTIERSRDLREAVAELSVRSGDLHRYFVESLVDHLPSPEAQFLVHVSFVDALSPSLCEAITGHEHADKMLASLREHTPIFAEGADSDWSRIHPLAQHFLQSRFANLPEEEQRELHARAARWLEKHGQLEEAARQLLRAGQTDHAYELVERCLYDVLVTGQVSSVADWIERLPREEILRRTRLRRTVGWMLAQSDRHPEAAQLVGSIIEDVTADAGDRCESAEICATAAMFADDLDGMSRIVSTWYETLPTDSSIRHLVGINQLAFLTLYRGAPAEARYNFVQVTANDEEIGRYALGWRDWIIGISYLWEGLVDPAEQKLRVALARAERDSGRRSPIAVTLAAALAAAQWERDCGDDAAALLANRLDVLERRAPPDAIVMGYITASRIAAHAGDEPRALDLLEHLFELGAARQLPRLRVASIGEQMRMHAVRGRAEACRSLERQLDEVMAALVDHEWELLRPVTDLQVGLARAYAAVARHEWKDALERLDALAPVAQRLHRGRDGVQIDLLKALATARLGRDEGELMQSAVSTAKMCGLVRILADTHPELAEVEAPAQAATGSVSSQRGPAARGQSPATQKPLAAGAARVRVTRGSLLSPRERDVLQLLTRNLSNKQIALAMGVTDETVKWHLKNLFGKLNAASRSHLLHRARMMGILDVAA